MAGMSSLTNVSDLSIQFTISLEALGKEKLMCIVHTTQKCSFWRYSQRVMQETGGLMLTCCF